MVNSILIALLVHWGRQDIVRIQENLVIAILIVAVFKKLAGER
jgi:hypothetical protein